MLLLVNINVFYIKITILIQFKFKSNLILKLTKSKNLASGCLKWFLKNHYCVAKATQSCNKLLQQNTPPYKKRYAIYNIKFIFYLNILIKLYKQNIKTK